MLCQFLVLAGKKFWFNFGSNTYLLLRLQDSCGGVIVFCLQWEIVFGVFDRKKKIQSSVWWVRNHYYDRKKRYSRLSGGCVIIITTGKKDTVVCLVGARSLSRP